MVLGQGGRGERFSLSRFQVRGYEVTEIFKGQLVKRHRRLAFVGSVVGLSVLSVYTVNALAKRWPNSPVATVSKGLKGS